MKPLSDSFTICLLALFCSGCVLKYQDVSNEPEYAPLLSTRYLLKTDMFIYGINLPPGYGKDINIYRVYPVASGKVVGPEIITEDILSTNSIIEVLGVRGSVNHLPGYPSVDAVVEVKPYEKTADVPMVIDLKYLQSTNYMQRLETGRQ